jgi:hypothetical protein
MDAARSAALACGMLAAADCRADGIVYFDVLGVLGSVGLYLLGFIVLPIVVYRSRRKGPWLAGLLLYLVAPFAWLGIMLALDRFNAREPGYYEARRRESAAAFSAFCQGRRRVVHAAAAAPVGATLRVRALPGYGDAWWADADARLGRILKARPAECARIGLDHLEGTPGLCRAARPDEPAAPRPPPARYELALGETNEKVDWKEWGGWMTSSSIRIRDLATGAVLAQDTVYYLGLDTGVHGCPGATDQILSLLAEVFPRRAAAPPAP